jgi:hypothetical protein
MLSLNDFEFQTKPLNRWQKELTVIFKAWARCTYDVRGNDTEEWVNTLKHQAVEGIRRSIYGEIERKINEIERTVVIATGSMIVNDKIIQQFTELRELCKIDFSTPKPADSTVPPSSSNMR